MADNQQLHPYNIPMFPPSIKLERKKKFQEYKENEDMIKQQKIQAGIYQAPKSAKALNFDI
jgi:hypothetical protein